METIAVARCQKQVKLRMHPVLDGGESVTHIASDLLLIEYHIYINYLKKRCVSYWLIQFTKLPPCICTGLAGYIVLYLCCYTFFSNFILTGSGDYPQIFISYRCLVRILMAVRIQLHNSIFTTLIS